MGIWDQFLQRNKPIELKLAQTTQKAGLPKAPVLDTSLESLLRYSRRNELVFACIEKKAQAACDPVLIVEQKNQDGNWERIEDHPLLALMNKPNLHDDGESFLRGWIASENFADIVYCEKVRNRSGDLVELHLLNPASIKPHYLTTSNGFVLDYYSYNNGVKEIRFKEEELLIRRRHGIGSVYDGLSNVAVALGAIDADIAQTDYVRAFFNNDGVPSGQLIVKDRRISNEEAESLQQRWARKFARGGSNRKGIVVLDQSAEFHKIGANLNELEADSITGQIESRICMAFGVPPVLVGAYVGLKNVNQKASFEGALQDFWRGTMSPELKSLRSFLTWNLLNEFEDYETIKNGQIRVNWDLSQVEAFRENVNDLHTRTRENLKAGILTINEARAALGLEGIDGGDSLPIISQPSFSAIEESAEPELRYLNAAPEIKAVEAVEDAQAGASDQKKNYAVDGITLSRPLNQMEQHLDLKGLVEDLNNAKKEIAQILAQLRTDLIAEAAKVGKTLTDAELYSMTLTPPSSVYKKIEKILARAIGSGSKQIVGELVKQGAKIEPPIIPIAKMAQRLAELTISRTVNEMQTRAISQLATQLLLGVSPAQASDNLVGILTNQSDKWVDSFAGNAANVGIQEGRGEAIEALKEEWDYLEYSALLDLNTCEPCAEADGKTAAKYEDLPATPNPDCAGADRCRCFIVAVYDQRDD